MPPVNLLADPEGGYIESQEDTVVQKRAVLQQMLSDFGIGAEVVGHMTGPVITMFELSLEPGVKVSQVAQKRLTTKRRDCSTTWRARLMVLVFLGTDV